MDNVIRFPVIARPAPATTAQPAPAYLQDWLPFLAVVECDHVEALPIRGHAEKEGPVIVYNPKFVALEDLEDWGLAMMWLSPCLVQIAGAVLAESVEAEDGIGRFRTRRWQAFRREVVRLMRQDWNGKGRH